jgi:hypothetical protein
MPDRAWRQRRMPPQFAVLYVLRRGQRIIEALET